MAGSHFNYNFGFSILTDACVKTDFITSDHLPLCFIISIDNLHIPVSSSDQTSQDRQWYNWCDASDVDLYKYYSCTRTELDKIKLPMEALQCEDISCTKHRKDIDDFYYSITNCLQGCVKQCIPKIKIHNVISVAGWNEYVIVYRPGYFNVHPPPRLQVDQNFLTQKIAADPKMRCHQKSFGIWRVTEAILDKKNVFFFQKTYFGKKS